MKSLKALCIALFALTFAMITLGGVVHNTGSSLACPDWPLCFGQVFPPMEGQVAIEHSHRLLGALIGVLCIGLVVLTWRRARPLLPIAFAILGVVIFQGILGGVTVLLKLSPLVSTGHLATSQIFFASVLYYMYRLHRLETPLSNRPSLSTGSVRFIGFTTLAIFVQMCLGAFIRHGGASVACGLGADSLWTCLDSVEYQNTLWPTTGPARMHMLHRFLGVAVAVLVIASTIPLSRYAKRVGLKGLRRAVVASHLVVCVQVGLGFLTVYTFIEPWVVTLHLVFGVTLWMLSFGQFLSAKENSTTALQTGSSRPKVVVLTT